MLIHKSNIEGKLRKEKGKNLEYINEIKKKYDEWIQKINLLKNRFDEEAIKKKVEDLTEYKDFIDTQEKLDEYMKTNLHDRIKQVKYLKNILLSDKRVKMDPILIEILSEINT